MTDAHVSAGAEPRRTSRLLTYAIGPALVLVALIFAIIRIDPLAAIRTGQPPVEDLTFERVTLTDEPRHLVATIVNGGPDAVTIAQVLVDDAFWSYEVSPAARVEPLGTARVAIDYPWVRGEPLQLTILTATGLTFSHTVAVAVPTPGLTAATLTNLALIGLLVGVIPVLIGLLWAPLLRRLSPKSVGAALAFTCGVLAFLVVDASGEAAELVSQVPSALGGLTLFVLAGVLAVGSLITVGSRIRGGETVPVGQSLGVLIAISIGLHNFGEGLAIAAAYSLGLVALTSLLVVGFAVHNASEGIAIVAPLGDVPASVRLLGGLGLVAGAPTILGTWLGALAYSPTLGLIFLGLGVGAIVQVIWVVTRVLMRRDAVPPSVVGGAVAGFAAMYLTSILVAI